MGSLQMVPRSGNRPMRYSQTPRNGSDGSLHGINSYEMGGVPSSGTPDMGFMPITALASALASASPEQQRVVKFLLFTIL